ncbi:MAG: NUDIX hydrolase [Rhodospirillaceae bacterium]|nr:NUDIX hydrolase [Rhodospirillaceae bacterium]
MKYCPNCSANLILRTPEGDNRARYCCDSCNTIFYQNPKNVVGTIPVYEDKILLCKRAIEPRKGKWTLPAGFMENGESSLEGAIRETKEEAGAEVTIKSDSLYTLFNLPTINQVYIFFRAELSNLEFFPGIESEEVLLYKERDIPWSEIAFPVVKTTIENYFEDRRTGSFPVRMFTVNHHRDRTVSTVLISASDVQSTDRNRITEKATSS